MHILKQLATKKGRDEAGLFVIEGEKWVAEIPPAHTVKRYIFSQSYADKHPHIVARHKQRAPAEILTDALFNRYADTQTPQGIAAICTQPVQPGLADLCAAPAPPSHAELYASPAPQGVADLCVAPAPQGGVADLYVAPAPQGVAVAPAQAGAFLLFGEALQDPGNVGTLIRTAAAAGAHGILLDPACADIFNPKTLRAAAGAILRIPILTDCTAAQTLPFLKKQNITRYAAHPHDGILPYNADLKKGLCLLIGNEARGLSTEALTHADTRLRLPMANESESLNASIAGGILLYEVLRHRL